MPAFVVEGASGEPAACCLTASVAIIVVIRKGLEVVGGFVIAVFFCERS